VAAKRPCICCFVLCAALLCVVLYVLLDFVVVAECRYGMSPFFDDPCFNNSFINIK
jgi:hypothetical protein